MTFPTLPTILPGDIPTGAEWDELMDAIRAITPIGARNQTATTVNNSTSLIDVTSIQLQLAANALFFFDYIGQYTTGTTPDIKVGWTVPTGATMDWGGDAYNTAEAFTAFGGQNESSTPGLGGTGSSFHLRGWILTSGTAGLFKARMAQNVNNLSNTSIDIGTTIEARRIA